MDYFDEESKIKFTTELSDSISINKRLGIEHLLVQKDVNKAAAIKKLEEERKAKIEFKEMVMRHQKAKRGQNMNKSYTSTKSKKTTKSKTVEKAKPEIVESKPKPAPTVKPKLAKKTNHYLYKKICTEIDTHIADIRENDQNTELINKDHLRIILVKAGFIGNNISDIKEIELDESYLDKIWSILKPSEANTVSATSVKAFIGVIMSYIPVSRLNHAIEEDSRSIANSEVDDASRVSHISQNEKLSKKFSRLSHNRFLHDQIKERQLSKDPNETFMPKINEKSAKMENKKMSGHKVPRYQVLLEKGNFILVLYF